MASSHYHLAFTLTHFTKTSKLLFNYRYSRLLNQISVRSITSKSWLPGNARTSKVPTASKRT